MRNLQIARLVQHSLGSGRHDYRVRHFKARNIATAATSLALIGLNCSADAPLAPMKSGPMDTTPTYAVSRYRAARTWPAGGVCHVGCQLPRAVAKARRSARMVGSVMILVVPTRVARTVTCALVISPRAARGESRLVLQPTLPNNIRAVIANRSIFAERGVGRAT